MLKKFKKYSKKKKIGILVLLLFVVPMASMFIAFAFMMPYLQSDLISDIEVINPSGATGTAFVAYRPGVSSFQKDITYAFIEGLRENDWRIEVTTISSQTPVNLTTYDLIVFGSPTYGGNPHDSVVSYFSRVLNLNKTDVAVIVTSGQSDTAATVMSNLATNANGTVLEALSFHLMDFSASEKSHQAGLKYT